MPETTSSEFGEGAVSANVGTIVPQMEVSNCNQGACGCYIQPPNECSCTTK